jgi:NDP-sugar pyrophosphorylase family protein
MKAVILAGGYGTRLSEETHLKPKPMVEIGDRPILWHTMKFYSAYGVNEFIICCGYKGYSLLCYYRIQTLEMRGQRDAYTFLRFTAKNCSCIPSGRNINPGSS